MPTTHTGKSVPLIKSEGKSTHVRTKWRGTGNSRFPKGSIHIIYSKAKVPATKEDESTTSVIDPLASWMEGVERINRSLGRTVGASPHDYVEGICAAYLEEQDKDLIYERIVRLSKLQGMIGRYANEVYALVGVGPEYKRAAQVGTNVNTVVSWLEEVFCYAMVDFREVQDRHKSKEFMYQAK